MLTSTSPLGFPCFLQPAKHLQLSESKACRRAFLNRVLEVGLESHRSIMLNRQERVHETGQLAKVPRMPVTSPRWPPIAVASPKLPLCTPAKLQSCHSPMSTLPTARRRRVAYSELRAALSLTEWRRGCCFKVQAASNGLRSRAIVGVCIHLCGRYTRTLRPRIQSLRETGMMRSIID